MSDLDRVRPEQRHPTGPGANHIRPQRPPSHELLRLQRLAGNAAVSDLVAQRQMGDDVVRTWNLQGEDADVSLESHIKRRPRASAL